MVKTGKVMINGEIVKASREIKVGEKFSIKKNTAVFTYEVIDLVENRVGAKLVENYLRDITPLEEIEKYKEYQMSQKEYREMGFGKPTKKDRRNIRKFLGD